jgi:hypothetical protein
MWSVGRYDYGLTDDEFWSLNLARYVDLGRRHRERYERECSHAALVCMVLANIHRPKRSKAFTVDDFMPGRGRGRAKQPQSVQQMKDMAIMLTRAFGGVIKEPRKDR